MSAVKNVPEGWVETTLGEVCQNISRPFNFSNVENVVFINTSDVLNGKFLHNEYISKIGLPGQAKKAIEFGDILFSEIRPANGRYALVDFISKAHVVSTKFMVIKKNEKIDLSFLYIYLTNSKTVNQFQMIADSRSGTFPQITFDAISHINILLPTIPEQKSIAAILTAFDNKIELLQAQNKTLEETAQTIFKEWFGKYQIGDKLPEGWRVGKLGEIIDIFDSQRIPLSKGEREAKKGKYPYHGATSIMDYIDEYIFDGIYLLFAEDGSVIDDNGYPFLQYVWGKFWVNNHSHVLTGKNGFSTEMLYVFCKKMKVSGIVNGAVQLKINQGNLLGYEIVIPNTEILLGFDKVIQPLFQKTRTNSTQIQSLTQTRDELLPKLMSGELRVNEFDK